MERFAREVAEAKERFPKNIFEIPSHRKGYRTIISRLQNKLFYFDFPPDFPFSPPKIWTDTHQLNIASDHWFPRFHFMLLLGLAQDILDGKRQKTGWTVVRKTACAVCSEIATKQCGGCYAALYCGQACQKTDWEKAHKFVCLKE